MNPIRRLIFAVLISWYACGARSALAHQKHNAQEAARHAAEHERKKQAEAARHAAEHAEHERRKQAEAARHAAERAEHERKQHEAAKKAEHERKKRDAAKEHEHEKKTRAESEARIAAARKARAAKPVQKSRQTARDRQIAGTLSKVAVNLHRADHDYDWQRHEAVEQVLGALHKLNEPEPNVQGRYGDMSQKRSDQILRESIPTLESVKSELSAPGAPANHREARVKIEEALSNIHASLRIR